MPQMGVSCRRSLQTPLPAHLGVLELGKPTGPDVLPLGRFVERLCVSVLFRRVFPDELVSYSSTYTSFLNSQLPYCRLLSVLHFEPLNLVPHGTNRAHDAYNGQARPERQVLGAVLDPE